MTITYSDIVDDVDVVVQPIVVAMNSTLVLAPIPQNRKNHSNLLALDVHGQTLT